MGATPEELRDQIERTRSELTADVDSLADRVSPARIARRRTEAVRGAAGNLRGSVMGRVSAASDGSSGAPDAVVEQLQGNPLAAGMIAFGAGLLLAALVPTTVAEEHLGGAMKDSAGDLAEPVKQAAQEQLDVVKEAMLPAVQDAAEHVKDSATDAAAATTTHVKEAAAATADEASSASARVKQSGA